MTGSPQIKGVMINAQIERLRKLKGQPAVRMVEEQYGQELKFESSKFYDTKIEEDLINIIVKVIAQLENKPIENVQIEAGKYHCNTFMQSPFAKVGIIVGMRDPKKTLMLGKGLFKTLHANAEFECQPQLGNHLNVILHHGGYTLQHYQGWLIAFLEIMNKKNINVTAVSQGENNIYSLAWGN